MKRFLLSDSDNSDAWDHTGFEYYINGESATYSDIPEEDDEVLIIMPDSLGYTCFPQCLYGNYTSDTLTSKEVASVAYIRTEYRWISELLEPLPTIGEDPYTSLKEFDYYFGSYSTWNTETLPEYMFINNTQITLCPSTVGGCGLYGYDAIPDKLFYGCRNLTDLSYFMYFSGYSSSIDAYIPSDLFLYSPKLTNIRYALYTGNAILYHDTEFYISSPYITDAYRFILPSDSTGNTHKIHVVANSTTYETMVSEFGDYECVEIYTDM